MSSHSNRNEHSYKIIVLHFIENIRAEFHIVVIDVSLSPLPSYMYACESHNFNSNRIHYGMAKTQRQQPTEQCE